MLTEFIYLCVLTFGSGSGNAITTIQTATIGDCRAISNEWYTNLKDWQQRRSNAICVKIKRIK